MRPTSSIRATWMDALPALTLPAPSFLARCQRRLWEATSAALSVRRLQPEISKKREGPRRIRRCAPPTMLTTLKKTEDTWKGLLPLSEIVRDVQLEFVGLSVTSPTRRLLKLH